MNRLIRFALLWTILFGGIYLIGGAFIVAAFDLSPGLPKGFTWVWGYTAAMIAAVGAHEAIWG